MLLDFIGLRLYTVRGQLKNLPAVQSWIDDGVYELQRRAYELYTKVPWDRTHKEVPVTSRSQMLHSLSRCASAAQTDGFTSFQSPATNTPKLSTSSRSARSVAKSVQFVQPKNVAISNLHMSASMLARTPSNPQTRSSSAQLNLVHMQQGSCGSNVGRVTPQCVGLIASQLTRSSSY